LTSQDQERDYAEKPLEVLSFGAGKQSTVMLLLVIDGRLPKPDIVIHSDTGSEMPHTEPVLDWAEKECLKLGIPFEIVRSKHGKLHEKYMENNSLPMVGMRTCTGRFKIEPVNQRLREIVGKKNGVLLANSWIGITTDEISRRGANKLKWIQNVYPLLDVISMSRNECQDILTRAGMKVEKSGCFCCPYAGVKHFIKLRKRYPDLFKISVDMERGYFKAQPERNYGLLPTLRSLESLEISPLTDWGFDFDGISECDPEGGCFL
jgi:3'-phosphoadenosine 5'-phosphosulfate sulfotransferase (PAPS reductase)/FAD synthetase